MPSVEKHIKSSLKRTGREFKKLHEWMDSEYKNHSGLKQHNIINIPENIKIVEKNFGKEAINEFLWHIKDDNNQPKGIIRRIVNKFLR